MKKVEAYIQPFLLSRVLRELRAIHVHGLTVTDVRGFGREKDESYPHHAAEYAVDFTPKLHLQVLCRDEQAEELIDAIVRSARTGRRGDGKVFVSDLRSVVSIRTGATDEEAL